MATMRTMAWVAVLALATGACSRDEAEESSADASAGYAANAVDAAAPPPAPPAPAAMTSPEMDRLAVTGSRIARDGDDGGRLVGQQNDEGSFLAYAHDATIRTDADQIGPRVDAVREACMTRKFGECTVLGASQQAGEYPNGMLHLRAEPKAIQPLVALAADGAELASRSTSAEDLADAVRDNGLRRARLEKQHARLLEFLDREDLTAESLVALTGQLAQIEAELQYAEQEAAQQQRRIRTNLLTLNFVTSGVTVESSSITRALANAGNMLDRSVATLITLAIVLLPFAVVGAIGLYVLRALIRRRRARIAAAKR